MRMTTRLVFTILLMGSWSMTAQSDEGMWLLTDPPRDNVKSRYGFDLTDAFVNRAMRSTVRFSGSSGGFVSPRGLVVTNHHVGSDAIQKLSSKEHDYLRDGFLARTEADELKCPDLELNVLQSIEDVTARVLGAVKPEMTPAAAAAARRAVMSTIEKESFQATGLRSDVITLYQGGVYHLYRSKKYTDVRLVFAPESGIASFGGDVDNYEYPRHSLDAAFFRVYENGKPASTPDYFRWSPTGPAAGDLVFVTGHPGVTNRLETLAKLIHRRDVTLPYSLNRIRAMEAALLQYSEESPEQRRQAANDLHRVANVRKADVGRMQGLLDPAILAQKQATETELQAKAPASIGIKPWTTVANAQKSLKEFEVPYSLLETGHAFASPLYSYARHAVRMAEELPKPNADRLREYRDSNLDSLKLQLYSPAPIYPDLERRKLQTSLTFMAECLGGDHPLVKTVLAGKNPAQRAADLIAGTTLIDPAKRKALVDGGKAAIEASKDPLVQLALSVDKESRALRKRYEEQVDEPEQQAYTEIARVRFAVYGKSVPPDATGTLRLAYGTVKGYEVDGKTLPANTTFRSLYEKSTLLGGAPPFDLPRRWADGRDKLDLETPFNFASTSDTINGNSGSPVLNREGELVGLNFDRNRHGLVRNFVYTDVQARHVSVHSKAVLEALTKLYGAEALVKELTGK